MNWISVEDRLPPREVEILICNDITMIGLMALCLIKGKDIFYTTNFEQILLAENITHWMPLPNPPTSEETP